jgi:hypothetical protein
MTESLQENAVSAAAEARGEPAIARPWLLLGGGLVIGFVGEALLHGQPPGLGYAVAALMAVAIWLALGGSLGVRPSAAGLALLVLILFVSAMVAVRASPALTALNVCAGMGLALLLAAVYAPGGLPRFSLGDYVVALVLSGLATVIQPFVLIFSDLPKARPAPGRNRNGLRLVAPALWGLLLALPLLLLFGALFASADAVFADYVRRLFDWKIDWADLFGRAFLSLVLSWLALGLARHAFTAKAGRPAAVQSINLDFLRVGGTTAITALALVNALFVTFVVVQAVYLFGGADTLARSGLTYSEYARRGFFELVTVAALVLSLVLLTDWLARFVGGRARLVVNILHTLLIVLTLAILASALQRMRLYQQEFGLTELRLYTTAFMGWLAVVLVWLVATVLVARSEVARSESEEVARSETGHSMVEVAWSAQSDGPRETGHSMVARSAQSDGPRETGQGVARSAQSDGPRETGQGVARSAQSDGPRETGHSMETGHSTMSDHRATPRRRFAFGALVSGLALVVVLNLLNPDALIARTNLDRAVAGVGQPLDARYLTRTLSADAVPTLLAGLERLPSLAEGLPDSTARRDLACGLQVKSRELNLEASNLSWRGGNLGKLTAWHKLAAAETFLARYAVGCPATR